MKKLLFVLLIVTTASLSTARAGAIIYEGFNYSTGTGPDPDGGLNGGNGESANTSTGLRGAYGSMVNVVSGSLSYPDGAGNTLNTVGNSANITNATWGTDVNVYKSMATDPYLAQRIGGTNTGAFGVDGTSLYVSFLGQTSSTTAQAFRFMIGSANRNLYVENTGTTWTLNDHGVGAVASTASMTTTTTALFVLKLDFVAGSTGDTASLWVNPSDLSSGSLGTANATVTFAGDFDGISKINTKPTVGGAMTLDEFRMGTTLADVLPYTAVPEPSTYALLGMGLAGVVAAVRRRKA